MKEVLYYLTVVCGCAPVPVMMVVGRSTKGGESLSGTFLWPTNIMSDLTSALQRLANYRSHNTRASKDVFESGVVVLKQNAINKLGDDST